MRYDIIVTRINNPHAASVLARRLAHNGAMSLDRAMAALKTLPVPYDEGVSETQAGSTVLQLRKIGVLAKVVESSKPGGREPSSQASPMSRSPGHAAPASTPIYDRLPPLLSTTQTTRNPRRRWGAVAAAVAVLVLAGAIAVLVHIAGASAHSPSSHRAAQQPAVSAESGQSQNSGQAASGRGEATQASADKPDAAPQRRAEPPTSPEQKLRAAVLADSARQSRDRMVAVNLYKAAIYFNRRNVDSWYGLLNAYRDLGMLKEAADTREEMQRLFGDKVWSLNDAIARYGRPQDVEVDDDRVLRVEIEVPSVDSARMVNDAYHMMESLRSGCGCRKISLIAREKGGSSMIVAIDTENFPATLRDFVAKAAIMSLPGS
jgi:hypothetical protein